MIFPTWKSNNLSKLHMSKSTPMLFPLPNPSVFFLISDNVTSLNFSGLKQSRHHLRCIFSDPLVGPVSSAFTASPLFDHLMLTSWLLPWFKPLPPLLWVVLVAFCQASPICFPYHSRRKVQLKHESAHITLTNVLQWLPVTFKVQATNSWQCPWPHMTRPCRFYWLTLP